MKEIDHVLVCLDLTEIDPRLIRYAVFISGIFGIEKISFIHAIQAYDLPDRRKKSFPDVKDSLESKIREELDELIEDEFKKKHAIEIIIRIEEEDAADGVLKSIEEHGVDLALIGQKFGEDRKGRYGRKIADHAPCDIIFVPEDPDADKLEKAMCAIDFSEASEAAFQVAVHLAEHFRVEVLCYYVQDLSRAYFPSSTLKSASRKKTASEQNYEAMLEKYNVNKKDFPCRIEPGDSMISEPEKFYEIAEKEDVQLIIIGARGDTANETSLLGNITETLRRMQTDIPIMIVKDGDQKSFFGYFRSGEE